MTRSPLERATWAAIVGCGTRDQLRAVAARIRRGRHAFTAAELAKLRAIYRIRWEQVDSTATMRGP